MYGDVVRIEGGNKRQNVVNARLAASQYNHFGTGGENLGNKLVNAGRTRRISAPSVDTVAPRTAHGTAEKAYEKRAAAAVRSLALKREKSFGYRIRLHTLLFGRDKFYADKPRDYHG